MASDSTREIQALRRELENQRALVKAFQASSITFRVSAKKGVSVYGLSKFPVTLYKSQWLKLLSVVDALREFIREHDHELPLKGE
jgi:hypothetical protein